jgi:hypothetical protein
VSNDPNDNPPSPQASSSAVGAAVVASTARRRLLRGGLVAGPVLMTVASRPVMAQVCMTSSASTSMAGSRPNETENCVLGRTPTSWLKDQSGSSGYLMAAAGGTKDKRTFGNLFVNGGSYATMTLVEVMNAGKTSVDRTGVAAHLVAAYLNAERGLTPATVLSLAKAQTIWSDYSANGKFVPTAGVDWREPQIIDWLLTTMPVNT